MSKISERAQKILTQLQDRPHPNPLPGGEGIFIRQQTLAEQFGCSRRTIGRALQELKTLGLLVDLNKRHANRCKIYEIKISLDAQVVEAVRPLLTPQAELQLNNYRYTFEVNFQSWPDWEKYYPQVTWELAHEHDIHYRTYSDRTSPGNRIFWIWLSAAI